MAGCTEQLTRIINAALSNSAWWQQRPMEKSQMAVRRSFGAGPVCRHWETSPTLGTADWERGAEPAQSSGLNHKRGCEVSAVAESVPHRQVGSAPKGNISIFLI